MKKENPLEIFQKVAPEVQKAFGGLLQSLTGTKGLDPTAYIYLA